MHELTDKEFDALITRAMDELPQEYITGLDNVAIVMADEPTPEQKEEMKLRDGTLLLGLYEGVPLTHRGNGPVVAMPDKITLFKKPLLKVSRNREELFEEIKHTIWHEIAHYYGLSHAHMDKLQQKDK